MLTKFDELTCHQAVTTFDHPSSSDRAWTEKLWCNVHDRAGELVLATGFGVYPNRNVMDGYACVNLSNRRQTNLRLSRELRPRIDEVVVGPLSYDVLDPYRRIRLRLDDNDRDLAFDFEFLGRLEPGEEAPHFGRSRGRVHVNLCRYAQLGRAQGWVRVGDRRIELAPERHYAQRDHSWGIRMGVGLPEPGTQAPDFETFTAMMINWITLQFEDWGVLCYYIEKADGRVQRLTGHVVHPLDAGRAPVPIVGYEHDFEYHPDSQRMRAGRVLLRLADGTERAFEMRELTCMYLRGGGYVGIKDFTHGQYKGERWSDGETFDLTDPQTADQVHGLDDTVIEVRSGDQTGYGIIENMLFPPFPRYGITELPQWMLDRAQRFGEQK
jgi:hypothetical protein